MQRISKFIVLGLLAALLSACSGQNESDSVGSGQTELTNLTSLLPTLPELRQASVLIGFTQMGNQALLRAASAVDVTTSLRLPSAPGGICWGIWGFSNGPDAQECTVSFTGDAGAEAWFAISDFSTGVWEIRGPLPGPQALLTLDDPRYSDASGNLFIAVLSYDGASVLVSQLSLTADIGPIQLDVNNSGGYTSAAMVNGSPAIAYYDTAGDDLKYVRATDLFGASWGTAKTPDSSGDTGLWTSLKVVDGFPAIAYYDATVKVLRYVRALDADGANWGAPLTVDPAAQNGEFCSLDVIAGNPAISYFYFDGPALRYVRALDSTGASWGTPVPVDSDGNTGQYSSLEQVNSTFESYPAISYRSGSASELRYARGTDAVGTTWTTPLILDDTSNAGFHSSLALISGTPAICYYDGSESTLRYIHAMDLLGDTWAAPQTLDGLTDDAGAYCSLAYINSAPCISYHNGLNGDLRFIRANDTIGDSWGAGVILDEISILTGRDTFLLDVYGVPGMSYYDHANGKLRWTWGN